MTRIRNRSGIIQSTWQERDGTPKKVRSKLPRTVYNYGELLPFLDIIRELELERHLDMMSDNDRNMLFAVAINRVCRPLAMHNLHYWYESSYLSELYPADNPSGQHLGNLLYRIGDTGLSELFHARLLKGLGTDANTGLRYYQPFKPE